MNLSILEKEVQDFIHDNLTAHISKLAFKGSPFENVSVQELINQIVSKNKCKDKLPTWFLTPKIYYPPKLNIEQTSSEATAQYKASLLQGHSLIDITGGFGIDCYYFSKSFKEVTHCEIDKDLSEIASYNFKKLEAPNVKAVCEDGILYLKSKQQKYDWIFVDPSRRNDQKGKVFRLTDCLPNIPLHIETLFNYTDAILIKTAPLLDLKIGIDELKYVHEIHIVAISNEVKEVLFMLCKNKKDAIQIKTINISSNYNHVFNFTDDYCAVNYAHPLKYLYEPNKAILKSGAFNKVAERFDLFKIANNTHLYTSDSFIDFPGFVYEVIAQIPYNANKIKELLPELKANIKIRNFPDNIATIKKKLKLKDGGNLFVFFTTNLNNKLIVVITKKTHNC